MQGRRHRTVVKPNRIIISLIDRTDYRVPLITVLCLSGYQESPTDQALPFTVNQKNLILPIAPLSQDSQEGIHQGAGNLQSGGIGGLDLQGNPGKLRGNYFGSSLTFRS